MLMKALVATIAALVLAVPMATAVEPAPKGFLGAFELEGTNGYELRGLIGSTGKFGEMTIIVDREGEEAGYTVRGEVTKENADFDLGSLGRVDVAIRPTGEMETVHPACGKPATVEGEEYVGSIEFHGEEGFTEASATSTPLSFKPLLEIVCGAVVSEGESGDHLPGAELKIERPHGPKLQVDQNRPGARVFYEASISEKEGKVRVNRSVRGHLPGSAMTYDPSLDAAHFHGTSPFFGAATYESATEAHGFHPGKGIWRGNLKVNFPGHAAVPLAGPSFSASIVAHTHRGTHG
jgi:hypothetical protein